MMITVAVWAEDFEGLRYFPTLAEAEAFARGWTEGANEYGAGKTTTYILPRERADLAANPADWTEVVEALLALAAEGDDDAAGLYVEMINDPVAPAAAAGDHA